MSDMMAVQDPGITVEQIVDSVDALTKELESLKPEDRLGYLSGMIRCANASYPSSVAVFQLLHNPERVSVVEEDKLKDLFSKFKSLCIERMKVNKDILESSIDARKDEIPPIPDREQRPGLYH
ncbi:MAG: hypothetical protein ACE5KG_04285 [Nitrososphaerales archaeon]